MGFLVLATSIFLFAASRPLFAQFPIRQMPGPKGPGHLVQGPATAQPATVYGRGPQAPYAPAATAPPSVGPPGVQSTALPAVARIVVPEKDGVSYGSGTLIDTRGQFGLVISNWHVVRDAAGGITVEFPDGFKSPAEVVKTDKDWDLAALSIYRPRIAPLPITAVAPQPGDILTIGGYGSGSWRMASGRCTQYLAPGVEFPHEMVELATEARQGDSGGPILNQRGELAGVLFGSGPGYTSGSFGGRVLQFLTTVVPGGTPGDDGASGGALADNSSPWSPSSSRASGATGLAEASATPPHVTALRQNALPQDPPAASTALTPAIKQPLDALLSPPARSESTHRFGSDEGSVSTSAVDPRVAVLPSRLDLPPSTLPTDGRGPADQPFASPFTPLEPRVSGPPPATDLNDADPQELAFAIWNRLSGPTFFDQTKTVLALVGVLSLVIVFLRFGGEKEKYHEGEAE